MPRALWKGQVIADSQRTEMVEGNHYFPPESVNPDYLAPSERTSHCGWKGTANYYDLVVDNQRNPGAAWYYADPLPAASNIKGYIAFWNGVEVES
jgi:uncharacterized protein (DUF427 family)